MKIKSFKELREAVVAHSHLKPKKSTSINDDESPALKPRAEGEQEFANDHEVKKTNYPVETENQFTSKAKQAGHDAPGESSAKQGTSSVKQIRAAGKAKADDISNQERMQKVVAKEEIEVTPLPEFLEQIRNKIAEDHLAKLGILHSMLSAENAAKMEEQIQSEEGLQQVIEFAEQNV